MIIQNIGLSRYPFSLIVFNVERRSELLFSLAAPDKQGKKREKTEAIVINVAWFET